MLRIKPVLTAFAVTILALCVAELIAGEDHEGHEGHEEDAVHLKPEALKAADLKIQAAGPGVILRTVEAPGEIQLNADRLAHITPRAAGVVEKVLKTVGDTVADGEVLAILQSPDLGNAKIEFYSTKVNLELAQVDLKREVTIHENTRKLLVALEGTPQPTDLEKTLEGASIGETKSKLLNAYSALRLARSNWERAKKLKEDTLISDANFDLAAKELESAQAEFSGSVEEVKFNYEARLLQSQRAVRLSEVACQNAERRLHILGLNDAQVRDLDKEEDTDVARYEVRAPFSGTIIEKHLAVGEQVGQDRDCFTVADLSTVWCDLRIYVSQLANAKTGQRVLVKVPNKENVLDAKVALIGPLISEKSRAASIRLVLENTDRSLRPGMFVTGMLILDETKVPLAIPANAIQRWENQSVVFVPGEEEGEFHVKPVQLGVSDGKLVAIQAGIEAGTKIVTRNSFLLKAEMGKGEGGHEH